MVYCNLKEHTKDSVTYAYGGETTDISGLIRFAIDGKSFEIIEEPKNSVVYLRSINRLYGKYRSDFSKLIFKEKISYEC